MESGQYFYLFSSGEALIWSVCSIGDGGGGGGGIR